MRTFERDGKVYTPAQIRRANPRIVYWVYFPQGIERYQFQSQTGYTVVEISGLMRAKTLKKALKLALRYNSAWIERIVVCDLGQWPVKVHTRGHRPVEELYAEWRKLDRVRIGMKPKRRMDNQLVEFCCPICGKIGTSDSWRVLSCSCGARLYVEEGRVTVV
jgi:hypothetical protein